VNCIFLDTVTPPLQALLCQEAPQEIDLIFWSKLEEADKAAALAQVELILAATYIVTDDLMSRAPKLKYIQKLGVGTDNIDCQAAAKRGIGVANVPGGNANSVAELTIGLILDLYRKISVLNRDLKAGIWSTWTYRDCSYEIKGKTHGIIGFGNIGQRVAQLSNAFGASVFYYNRTPKSSEIDKESNATYLELDELLQRSDIVSVHLPLSAETKNLIDDAKIALMKRNAILINVGRGNVVNEEALYAALAADRIAGAGIDVWANEPPEADNPLLALDNVIAIPHVGGGTVDAVGNIFRLAFQNVRRILLTESKP